MSGSRMTVVDKLKGEIVDLQVENKKLRDRLAEAEALLERVKAGSVSGNLEPLIEIAVSYAPVLWKPEPITDMDGNEYPHVRDESTGAYVTTVPESLGKGLLAATSGLQYHLVGPETRDSIVVERYSGWSRREVTLPRYTMSMGKGDTILFTPVKAEDA